ncbi:uncharacterized protein DNG_05636 [Cephalotrichum gorgonifer]|uniref:Uncharacterized protein n=1 Tax=Cephalotrichum gorgonifer TaxID=2041049 RepID=A0AAE8SVN3_9PEZI|nr:uncharacterized protein DNG_05636 [Cephalotrichum gorgonifer]
MSERPSPHPEDGLPRRPRPRGLLPPVLVELLVPSLKVGAMSGGAGAITGVAAGIIRDVPPALFAIASGIQWFTLGSSFWLSRSIVTKVWGGERTPLTYRDKVKASALAGCTAGTVGGLLRGPRNIIPGAIMFTIFGAAGQGLANKLDQWSTAETGDEGSSWLRSKYSPLRKLTDQEYEDFMAEKMLKVEADLALIDDKVAELKAEARRKEEAERKKAAQTNDLQRDDGAAPGSSSSKGAEEPKKASQWGWR